MQFSTMLTFQTSLKPEEDVYIQDIIQKSVQDLKCILRLNFQYLKKLPTKCLDFTLVRVKNGHGYRVVHLHN